MDDNNKISRSIFVKTFKEKIKKQLSNFMIDSINIVEKLFSNVYIKQYYFDTCITQ
jgi:hypothetical protein